MLDQKSWGAKSEKAMLDTTKESIEFDAVKRHEQQNNATGNTKRSTNTPQNCGYYGKIHK